MICKYLLIKCISNKYNLYLRKRILHKGYSLSTGKKELGEMIYVHLDDLDSLTDVRVYLKKNYITKIII